MELAFSDNVWVLPLRTPTLPPAEHTNAILHVGEQRLLFDPGTPNQAEQEHAAHFVESHCAGLDGVVLTHHHRDHVGAARALSQRFHCPIYAHGDNVRLLPNLEFVPIHATRNGSASLFFGLKTLHTPGHAPGHLVFIDEAQELIIAGDMVAGTGTILIDPFDGDMSDYLLSLTRLAELSPALRVIPAHGSVMGHDVFARTHAHRLSREARVLAAIGELSGGEPVDFALLLSDVYAETPAQLWPLASRSLESHLRKLEKDGQLVTQVAARPQIRTAFDDIA